MNFLAHIFLSGDNHQLMIGNFIADFVKGNKKNNYPDEIRIGIELHRAIDDFTDHHAITELSKQRLRPRYHKYSGVIVDLYYDHFLAKNFEEYSSVPLKEYSLSTYKILNENIDLLPEGVHYFLPFMIERNWLLNYATVEGIGRALTGLSKRVSFENQMGKSEEDLREYYSDFEKEFRDFFSELILFVEMKIV